MSSGKKVVGKPAAVEFRQGGFSGGYWDFKLGQGVPMHEHGEDKTHLSLVCWGEVEVIGGDGSKDILKAGQCTYFDAGDQHEIVCTVEPCRMYNFWWDDSEE